jgi:uncharacterized protein
MLRFLDDLNAANRSLRYIVVLNLDCNLACRYCFEGTRKGRHYLSDDVESQFVEFVQRSNWENKDALGITFYGGEPLLSIDRIVSISNRLRALCADRGLTYSFSLVTNGTLLTPAAVDRLAPLGLTSAKVTLDGPPEVHDSSRPFTSGAGSFEAIVRNITRVCDRISVQIGGNYTERNYRDFPRLLDHLRDRGLTPDRVPVVKFDPVVNESSRFRLPDFHDGCDSLNEPWLMEATVLLREAVLERGYRPPAMAASPCIMALDASLVVHYDGSLYTCPGLIGRTECSVGDVARGAGGCRRCFGIEDWKNETCLACAYLPLCFGGCRYAKLVKDGTMRGIACRKRFFDRTLGRLVAQDLRYGL